MRLVYRAEKMVNCWCTDPGRHTQNPALQHWRLSGAPRGRRKKVKSPPVCRGMWLTAQSAPGQYLIRGILFSEFPLLLEARRALQDLAVVIWEYVLVCRSSKRAVHSVGQRRCFPTCAGRLAKMHCALRNWTSEM